MITTVEASKDSVHSADSAVAADVAEAASADSDRLTEPPMSIGLMITRWAQLRTRDLAVPVGPLPPLLLSRVPSLSRTRRTQCVSPNSKSLTAHSQPTQKTRNDSVWTTALMDAKVA